MEGLTQIVSKLESLQKWNRKGAFKQAMAVLIKIHCAISGFKISFKSPQ